MSAFHTADEWLGEFTISCPDGTGHTLSVRDRTGREIVGVTRVTVDIPINGIATATISLIGVRVDGLCQKGADDA